MLWKQKRGDSPRFFVVDALCARGALPGKVRAAFRPELRKNKEIGHSTVSVKR
jgi:hypothetical protein